MRARRNDPYLTIRDPAKEGSPPNHAHDGAKDLLHLHGNLAGRIMH
jgi:hypothetical protein